MFESNYLLIMGLSGIVISLLIILHEPIFDGIDRIVARITVKKVLKKIDLYNGKIVFKEQIKQIFPSNKIYGLGVIGDSYTKDHIKSLFPKYAGIFKDDIWMSVEENNCDEFFAYPNFFVFERTIYPISFTTEKPIVDGIAYAEDGEARKAYREKLQDEEDTQRMKAHDNFVRTVQAAYEKEKIITVPLPESFFKMTTEEKLQYLASLDMNKGNTKIELTLNPGTLPDDPVVEEYKKLDN